MVVPSLLNSNILYIQDLINAINDCGENRLHIDVMDGHFVTMQAFGGKIVSDLKHETELILDVHLMIMNPELHLNEYIDADIISIHVESTKHVYKCINIIKKMEKKVGIAINPGTPLCLIEGLLPLVDQVIIMTVNPGSLKEKFIDSMLFKISELYKLKARQKLSFDIEVDGNINDKNIISCKESGANFFVSGGYVFKDSHYKKNISDLKKFIFQRYKREVERTRFIYLLYEKNEQNITNFS